MGLNPCLLIYKKVEYVRKGLVFSGDGTVSANREL